MPFTDQDGLIDVLINFWQMHNPSIEKLNFRLCDHVFHAMSSFKVIYVLLEQCSIRTMFYLENITYIGYLVYIA